ncbi:peroxide stress protein YaaA [Primorskyibacter sp. S187A]|uniref:peroxide stress protein YaaA n=1 Tax=Primorskyibacter sp. S187A TaxID=3415130 RepID=UPI003C79EBDA
MLVVISPAKRLDWDPVDHTPSQPAMQADAVRLSKTARNLTLRDLKGLMDLSDDLARLNRDRFRSFEAEPDLNTTRPAIFAFAGDTYQGLDARTMDAEALAWAQDRLRILSGLYGVLTPMDGIQPYRLEMGSRLKTRRGTNLYQYWGDALSKALNAQARDMGTSTLVNCASQEYFGAVDLERLDLDVITPQFMELKGGTPKIVSFFAKRARGAMARFLVENKLTEPKDILSFDRDGYVFDEALSSPEKPVFLREAQA